MEERREVSVQTRDGREEGGEGTDRGWKRGGGLGYRRGMEERREVRVQTKDRRKEVDEGYR